MTAKIQLPVANGTVIPVKCQEKGSINHGLTSVSCLGNNRYSRLRADCHTLELGRNTNLVSGMESVPANLRDMDASTCEMIDSLGKEGIGIGRVCPGGYCKVDYILLFGSVRFDAVAGKRRDGVWKYFYSGDLQVADNNITMPDGSVFQMINIHFSRSQRVCEVVIAGSSVTDVRPEPHKPKTQKPVPWEPLAVGSYSTSGSGTESFQENKSTKNQIKVLFDRHITAKNHIKTSEELRFITQNRSHLLTADDVQRTSLIIQRLVDFSEEELVAEVTDNILKTINSVHRDTKQSEFVEGNTASEMRKSAEMFSEKMAKGRTDSYQSESTVSVAVKHYTGGSTTDFSITGSGKTANSMKNAKFAGFEESSSHLFAASVPDDGQGRAVRAIFYDSTKFYPTKSTDDLENKLHDGKLGKSTTKKIASLVSEISYLNSPKTVKFQGEKRLKMQFTVKDSLPAVHFMTKTTSNYTCVYYDTETRDWKDSGCETTVRNKRVHCSCNHMTSYAILMSISSDSDPIESKVSKILLGVSLSCLICTIIAYLPAKKLLKTRPVRLNLLLVTSLILAIVTFYFMEVVAKSSAGQEDSASWGCNVVAFLMNYFWLCQMAWMVVEAVVMYRALVSCVLNSYIHRYMLKFNLVCWGLPLVFPIIGLCWGGARFANPRTCFLQAPYGYLTFYSPMAACVVFNTAIFIRIAGSIFRRKEVSMDSGKDVMRLVREFKSAVLAMSLFGVTWMFGFFLVFEQVNNTWLRYIFIALNSTQGIWIFVLYVLLKEDLKKVWKRLLGLAGPEGSSMSHILTSSSKVGKVVQPKLLVPEGIVAERAAMLYNDGVSTNNLEVTGKPNTARSTRNRAD